MAGRNQARPGNQNTLKHGGAAAEKALTAGADFTGLALQAEERVTDELATAGAGSIVRRSAVRLQAVADLYYGAIMGAETLERLDALVKRYGWLQAAALRAWAQVREEERAANRGLSADDVLDAIKRAGGTEGTNEQGNE